MNFSKRISLMVTLVLLIMPGDHQAIAADFYSPAYRVKSVLNDKGEGLSGISAELVLPGNDDINGVEKTGAAYNYLGLETGNGNSLEIGLHKDCYDVEKKQWSVFSLANYSGAFSMYGTNDKWHNFRPSFYVEQKWPTLIVPDGSTVSMSLEVVNNDEVLFKIEGQPPVTLKMPGADPNGKNQVLRRVTSLITEEPQGFLHNNIWNSVYTKTGDKELQQWLPKDTEKSFSNNMDQGDPGSDWVMVTAARYYPEKVNITMKASINQGAFQVGNSYYYVNGLPEKADVAPFIEAERLYVPVRYLAYVCGLSEGEIIWNQESQTVSLNNGDVRQTFTVDKAEQIINGVPRHIDAKAMIVEDRIFLPARYVVNQWGFDAAWDNANNVVYIYPQGQERGNNPFI